MEIENNTLTLKYKVLSVVLMDVLNKQSEGWPLVRKVKKQLKFSNLTKIPMTNTSNASNTISWIFGIIVFAIGVLNMFWGNDPEFGFFLLLLSFVYFPPINSVLKERTDFSIPLLLKILLSLFIIWVVLGVGELFSKIDLMMMDL